MLKRSAALVVLFALACAPIVQSERRPALAELEAPIRKVAVAPFRPVGRLVSERSKPGAEAPSVAASLVSRQIAEALALRVAVVPAGDVARALGLEGPPAAKLVPAEVARIAASEFGADAVLVGEVTRFVRRAGEAAGTLRPASVGFAVTLYSAPGGRELWRARFEETQQPLSENVLVAGRYPGGGTRWLTAEELSGFGASETVRQLPLGP